MLLVAGVSMPLCSHVTLHFQWYNNAAVRKTNDAGHWTVTACVDWPRAALVLTAAGGGAGWCGGPARRWVTDCGDGAAYTPHSPHTTFLHHNTAQHRTTSATTSHNNKHNIAQHQQNIKHHIT